MLPLAPGRFSITTDQPSVSCSEWAMSRAEMSGAPPGGIVTSTRIGRDGNGACASAAALNKAANASTTMHISLVVTPSSNSPLFCAAPLRGRCAMLHHRPPFLPAVR